MKDVKLEVALTLSDRNARQIGINAIERVINNAIQNAEYVVNHAQGYDKERASINADDWEELKPILTYVWVRIQDALYRSNAGLPTQKEDGR